MQTTAMSNVKEPCGKLRDHVRLSRGCTSEGYCGRYSEGLRELLKNHVRLKNSGV